MMIRMMDLKMVGSMVGILSESAEVLRAMIVKLEAGIRLDRSDCCIWRRLAR